MSLPADEIRSNKGRLFTASALHSRGPLCEIGVFKGATFRLLLQAAILLKTEAHAVDSFRGMAKPGPMDDGDTFYPEGKFDIGGPNAFRAIVAGWQLAGGLERLRVWPGYVPAVLDTLSPGSRFGFVHVDLDQYQPTLDAGRWAWEHTLVGGCVAFHDYLPKINHGRLATAAIDVLENELKGGSFYVEGDEALFFKLT